jgi:hypothetical protein
VLCEWDDLNKTEAYYIRKYDAFESGYNKTEGNYY